jgi:hypothetical protein
MRRPLAPVAVLIIATVALVGVGRAASAAPYGTTKAALAVIDLSGLAFTGVPALALGGIAAILLVGGVGLIVAGRRRSHVS